MEPNNNLMMGQLVFKFPFSKKYYEQDWAYKTSMRLLDLIHTDEKMKADKDKLDADIKIEDDKMDEVEKKIKEAYKTWYDGEFKGKKEDFNELNLY